VQGRLGIDEGGMSAEGAANLLRMPGKELDVDGDGMVSKGKMRMFSFPPQGAPAGIKDAWEKATEGMTIQDKVMASSALFLHGWGDHGVMQGGHDRNDYVALTLSAIEAARDSMKHQNAELQAASLRNIGAFERFLVNLG
jgi:hypothetical protein